MVLDILELESWLIARFRELGIELNKGFDFFSSGVDSLKAIQIIGLIIQTLDLGGNERSLPSMIVYDCGNIMTLSRKLYGLRVGQESQKEDELALMRDMIRQYSVFPERLSLVGSNTLENVAVSIPSFRSWQKIGALYYENMLIPVIIQVLTGATGFLGTHLLSELVANPRIAKIYCLIRITNTQSASERLELALKNNHLSQLITSPKIICLACNLAEPKLGLDLHNFKTLTAETTHIIHCAWTVNFALPLPSFRADLAGLQNLLSLSLSTTSRPEPAEFVFCSSIAVGLGTLPPALIPSTTLDLSQASSTGYARSKCVGEKVVQQAVEKSGARARVARIGQIVPSRKDGATKLWNQNEMIPLLIRSAKIVGALPDQLSGGDSCNWMEVDVVAGLICEIAGLSKNRENEEREENYLYNLVHPRSFSWRTDFLPKLKELGLMFQTVGYKEWLQKIRDSESDLVQNPSRKLLGFWESQKWARGGEVRFDTGVLGGTMNLSWTQLRVVDENLVADILAAWKMIS
jgi:thioester reductase-like protein